MTDDTLTPLAGHGVIFDMDGVLIDSYHAHLQSWRRMLREHGRDMTEEQFASTFGYTNPDIFATLYPQFDRADYDALGEQKEEAFRDIIAEHSPAMPGVEPLLNRLAEAGAMLAIGSSGPADNVRTVLDNLPGGRHIAAITHGQEVRRGKPDPEVFLTAADKIDLPPQHCAVIEDAPAGIQAAKAAGCIAIGLTGTVTAEKLSHADTIVHSLEEITVELVGQLLDSAG
jgi:beta-phosphoglucomutase